MRNPTFPTRRPARSGLPPVDEGEAFLERLYLDVLKRALTRSIAAELWQEAGTTRRGLQGWLSTLVRRALAARGVVLARWKLLSLEERAQGGLRNADGETMIGLARLQNLEDCVVDVVRRGIPGDLIEAGAWRGGATIFMRGVLKAYGDTRRIVWVADSFMGLPRPDPERYPADADAEFWRLRRLVAPLDEVKDNFVRYGLLDDQVRFLVGWFRDTLPGAPIDRLAVLRVDGDMYESTSDALRYLYPKLSVGGYAIVDDYGAVPACRAAVDDYRAERLITEPMEVVADDEASCVFWRRRTGND